MDLGEKLLHARQEAGLSQRQLCGEVITRNMLSQIEHGTARPSMDTLRYLAERLGKPVSWFLEEDVVLSPNQTLMEQARKAEASEAWRILKNFRRPDPMLEWEWNCRSFLSGIAAAEKALEEGKIRYARQLLEEVAGFEHGIPELERQRLLLLGRLPERNLSQITSQLPSLDEELLLRAEVAMMEGKTDRADVLLLSAEDRDNGKWNLLRGRLLMQQGNYKQAAEHLNKAEPIFGPECLPLLEACFRELGDFRKAYEYACKQR